MRCGPLSTAGQAAMPSRPARTSPSSRRTGRTPRRRWPTTRRPRPPTPRSGSVPSPRWPWCSAMACDLRFAAGGSKFGIPAAKLSIIYGLDPVHQLVDLVGPAYAKDILYSARTLDAPEALRIGFIQRLLPPSELEAYTYDYLLTVAENAPLSIRGTKAQVQAIFEGVNETHRRKLFDMGIETFNSQDYAEGTRAFLEKRKPVFKGK